MKKLQHFFLNSWWVLFFILFCYMLYERGLKLRNDQFSKLQKQYIALQQEKKRSLALNEDLLLQVNSHKDPAWIEMTLMKELGLVPEDSKKVMFIKEN